jgi:hypothetical protein
VAFTSTRAFGMMRAAHPMAVHAAGLEPGLGVFQSCSSFVLGQLQVAEHHQANWFGSLPKQSEIRTLSSLR